MYNNSLYEVNIPMLYRYKKESGSCCGGEVGVAGSGRRQTAGFQALLRAPAKNMESPRSIGEERDGGGQDCRVY
jgi:hypothetical protein